MWTISPRVTGVRRVPAVRREEPRQAHAADRRDPRQGLALAHPMRAVVALGQIALRRGHTRPGRLDLAWRPAAGQPQRISARHQAGTVPDRRPQRRIQHLERAQVDFERLGERIHGDVIRNLHRRVVRLGEPRQRTEILLGMTVDLERRQERDVEISRGEAEGRALVTFDDDRDVARSQFILRAPEAPGTVVIGRDGQRPAPEQPVVVQHQIGGGLRRAVRVQPLIDDAVHAHEALGGRGHELPQTRGADLGIGLRIERGLDVRERRDLLRNAVPLEHAGDVVSQAAERISPS